VGRAAVVDRRVAVVVDVVLAIACLLGGVLGRAAVVDLGVAVVVDIVDAVGGLRGTS